MSNLQHIKGRQEVHMSGTGAAAITIGGAAFDSPTRAIHCNAGGSAICTFVNGSTATLVFVEGLSYPYAIVSASTAGDDPELVAIF